MQYNIHPIFVHFPIAFLLVYSLLKIIPLRKWLPGVAWNHIEKVVLLVGVVGAFVAAQTGEIAEHLVRPDHNLVEMHSLFASISIAFYGLLVVCEFLTPVLGYLIKKFPESKLLVRLQEVLPLVNSGWLKIVLAVLGLVAITVTGLLGGVMVYGVTADPIAPIVLKLLGLSY